MSGEQRVSAPKVSDADRGARQRLFQAITILAGPAQAHRRNVQLGLLSKTTDGILAEGRRAQEFRQLGLLTAEQAELVTDVYDRLLKLRDGREDFLEQRGSEKREYLWGKALEDEEWRAVRHAARRCYTALARMPAPEGAS